MSVFMLWISVISLTALSCRSRTAVEMFAGQNELPGGGTN
jgi:hypothetical protein